MKILKYLPITIAIMWFSLLSMIISEPAYAEWETPTKSECKWIKLNTDIPFIGNCITTFENSGNGKVTPINAFPTLIGALMNLLMTVILIMSLLMIVWSWVLMTMSWVDASKYTKWVNLLKRVATWMALLGASWVILKVINPNFFI